MQKKLEAYNFSKMVSNLQKNPITFMVEASMINDEMLKEEVTGTFLLK